MNAQLDARRLWWLIRADVILGRRALLAQSMAVFAVVALVVTVSMLTRGGGSVSYGGLYLALLFLWGPMMASHAFRELHDKTANEQFLLIPASVFEKVTARLLRVTFGLVLYLVVFLTLLSIVMALLHGWLFGDAGGLFHPLQPEVWSPLGHYLVFISLYFAGAAWFRKYHWFKTTASLAGIVLLFIVLTVSLARVVFADIAPEDVSSFLLNRALADGELADLLRASQVALGVLYFAGVPMFCWWLTWQRVRETQVSDGV